MTSLPSVCFPVRACTPPFGLNREGKNRRLANTYERWPLVQKRAWRLQLLYGEQRKQRVTRITSIYARPTIYFFLYSLNSPKDRGRREMCTKHSHLCTRFSIITRSRKTQLDALLHDFTLHILYPRECSWWQRLIIPRKVYPPITERPPSLSRWHCCGFFVELLLLSFGCR